MGDHDRETSIMNPLSLFSWLCGRQREKENGG